MDWYDCTVCGQTLPEIGGYDEVDGKVICQTCLVKNVEIDKFQKIKQYFSKQSDWSTLTEFEYFKWLIQEIETLKNLLTYERIMHERTKTHYVDLQTNYHNLLNQLQKPKY